MKEKSLVDRFNAFITITPGCWIWIGYKDSRGYGILYENKKAVRAHRFSYELHLGPITNDLLVCHSCDNPSCVNPAHLWLGTHKDNSDDKMAKGRWSGGEPRSGIKHPMARLNEDDVYAIRADSRQIKVIAEAYNTTYSNIRGIKKRAIWKHLPPRDDEKDSIDGRKR